MGTNGRLSGHVLDPGCDAKAVQVVYSTSIISEAGQRKNWYWTSHLVPLRWELPGQCVRLSVPGSRAVREGEIKACKKQSPLCVV